MKGTEYRSSAGFSLIELMVAILLGVVLSFAAVNLFLRAKISYVEDEEYARLQENGRYALRLLSRELSMAGFLGGVFRGENVTTGLYGIGDACYDYLLNPAVPFEHHNNVTVDGKKTDKNGIVDPNPPVMPGECLTAGDHQLDTDMLVVRRTADLPNVVEGADQGLSIEDADIYLRKEEYNKSLTLVTGNQTDHAGKIVDVWEYDPQILFIRDWSRVEDPKDGIPALCRKRLPGLATECLVEGVENLQIEFGIDTDGDLRADVFVPAPASDPDVVPDPGEIHLENAVAARIYLLMRSVNEVTGYTNDRAYTLGSTPVPAANPPDGFYRRLFQTTVYLRNSKVFKF